MSKKLTLTYKGTPYTLAFTRNSVKAMESGGFVMNNLVDKPMNTLPALFEGAFKANHPYMRREVIEDIFNVTPRRNELFAKLSEMYYETVNSLMDEPEESEGNASWEEN